MTDSRTQKTITPIDGSVLLERPLATERDIEGALARALRAQRKWKQVPVGERVAIVRRMVDWCVAHADAIGKELTQQMGRPIAYTPNEIRRGFQERALYLIGLSQAALSDVAVEAKEGFRRFIRR